MFAGCLYDWSEQNCSQKWLSSPGSHLVEPDKKKLLNPFGTVTTVTSPGNYGKWSLFRRNAFKSFKKVKIFSNKSKNNQIKLNILITKVFAMTMSTPQNITTQHIKLILNKNQQKNRGLYLTLSAPHLSRELRKGGIWHTNRQPCQKSIYS